MRKQTVDKELEKLSDKKDLLKNEKYTASEVEHLRGNTPLSGRSEAEEGISFTKLLYVVGPGIMVCLADTDGPCLLTDAASGAKYGYSLLGCQMLLLPVLYAAQELTVRLALYTRMGLTQLIVTHFGFPLGLIGCTLLIMLVYEPRHAVVVYTLLIMSRARRAVVLSWIPPRIVLAAMPVSLAPRPLYW